MASSFCPRCGTQRTGALRFCRSCGLDFDADASPAAPAPTPGPTRREVRAAQAAEYRSQTSWTFLGYVIVGIGMVVGAIIGLLIGNAIAGPVWAWIIGFLPGLIVGAFVAWRIWMAMWARG